jgi:hypothetical protein
VLKYKNRVIDPRTSAGSLNRQLARKRVRLSSAYKINSLQVLEYLNCVFHKETKNKMNLNDIGFGGNNNGENSNQVKTPWLRLDYKNDKQFARLLLSRDFDEMKSEAEIYHSVDGVGRVHCNCKPIPDGKRGDGFVFMWDGWGKDKNTGERVNKSPESNCVFCAETAALKNEMVGKLGKETPEGKKAAIEANKLHRKSQELFEEVYAEIWEKKGGKTKPEKTDDVGVVLTTLRINDLTSDRGKGNYSFLKDHVEMRGALTDTWFTYKDGTLAFDRVATDDEMSQVTWENHRKPQILDYQEGLERYLEKKGEVDRAKPISKPVKQAVKAEVKSAATVEEDSEIPF